MKNACLTIVSIILFQTAFTQKQVDTLKQKELQEVKIKSWMRRDIDRLSAEEGGFLNGGKKMK